MSEPPADAPGPPGGGLALSIRGVRARPAPAPGELALEIETSRGALPASLHPREGGTGCAIFLGGAAGGGDGPADGVYLRLARGLAARGVTSLRLGYREPGAFDECVLDALAACSFLRGIGAERAAIVGHSFGGAVAIRAGGLAPLAVAVAALAPQRFGTEAVDRLGKPLLLIHGAADRVLLPLASEDIHARAREPKRIAILEGGGHSLREVAAEVHALLAAFVAGAVGDPPAAGA